jgi:phosphoglycolate phosphatase
LAAGSRHESTVAAALALHQTGLPWHEARARARAAFDQADLAVDFYRTSKPLPGVPEAVRALHAAGWHLAIATTDQTDDAWKFLHLAGIADRFGAVIGADRVGAGKPDPAMFHLACQESGVAPGAAVMVGDLDVDLLMGRAGGARLTAGVLSGVGDPALLAPHADLLVADVPALASELLRS